MSEAILPAASMLEGCGISVSWTRAVLYCMLGAIHRTVLVQNYLAEIWIDD